MTFSDQSERKKTVFTQRLVQLPLSSQERGPGGEVLTKDSRKGFCDDYLEPPRQVAPGSLL